MPSNCLKKSSQKHNGDRPSKFRQFHHHLPIFNGTLLFHSELMRLIRTQARIFVSALPQESVIANMARRVLKLIREESDMLQAVQAPVADDSQSALSLHKLVTQTSESEKVRDYSKPQDGLRAALLDHLQGLDIYKRQFWTIYK